jgi:subtilisin-like proprotein convertase family protein
MSRKLIPFVFGVALVLALAPGSASAQSQVFRSADPVEIPSTGNPSPNPTTVNVNGMHGPVTEIEVSLEGVFHSNPDDLDVVLVAPDGSRTVLMSDACGGADVANRTWTFKPSGALIPAMPDQLSCPGTFYLDTNHSGGDVESFPGTGTGSFVSLSNLQRQVLNGVWKLAVFDDKVGDGGTLLAWSITLTTGDTEVRIPHQGTSGLANPYPLRMNILDPEGNERIVTDLNVAVVGISHSRPDDLELLLVGPQGQRALLMSDACGDKPLNDVNLGFDDEAPAPRPDGSTPACDATAKPTDHEPGDRLPAPAPQGAYSNSLSVFDGTELAGAWSLYAFDDADGAEGYTLAPFFVLANSRLKAAVEFAQATVEVSEGNSRLLTVRRAAEESLGAGTVVATTTAGTARAGADYTSISRTIAFAAGEREKTVEVDALADATKEDTESYKVTLSQPAGDARLGARATATVSVRDGSAKGTDGSAKGRGASVCAGRRVTITGTAKSEVLRGTAAADVIAALGGKDKVKAGGGKDVVCGGRGNDRITGGAGRDACYGGPGRDRIRCERKRAR